MAAPVFDAAAISAASGVVSNTVALSWTHLVGSGPNNCGIVAAICSNNGAAGGVVTGTPTASIGGQSLPYLGTVLMGNVAIGGFIAVWSTNGVPTGSQTAQFSITDSGQNFASVYGISYTYTGVGGIGALQTAFSSSTSTQTVSVPTAVGHTVWGALGNYQNYIYTGLSYTSRESQFSTVPGFDSGDMAGASGSVTFGATQQNNVAGAIVGLDLLPVFPTTPNNNIGQAIRRASLY